MGRESRETWAKRVERWQDSGLTAKEYAAELGINAHSLSWWKWRLAATKDSSPAPSPRRSRRATPAGPMTFIEIPPPPAIELFEVVLPSSLRVRVPATFDAPTLVRLLDVLEQRR
jgi:transposase